ncbi:hypothetical protein [Sphingobacterium sp. BIGb0165]|uniref:hypothetical protein n=1 Tax=Sphingobacterium sp. BIGb0165 TaxID=2940615 RepID=UPI00216A2B0F|nr:hypothetical protein [Sphingobacterium sp. BIGb0165]MCS4224410.1 hypothetical protein [Sphingobacterium sp. BIGb0165]
MEKTLQHSIVKQGLIILYYFSNRWYRKCLFTESHIPALNATSTMKTSVQDLDKTNTLTEAELSCNHKDENNDGSGMLHQISKKSGQDKDLKKTVNPKKNTD